MTNLADVLLAPGRTSPDATALRAGPDAVTYRELEARAARVAGAIRSEGVEPGARVTIEGHNTIAFVASYLGVLRAGVVAVPLNPHAPDPELDRQLATVEPAVVLGPLLDGAGDAEPADAVPRDDADVAVLLFTAGTAGAPKAAMLTHGNMASNIRQVLDHPGLALNAGDVSLGALPLFHVFGLNAVLGIGLAAGASTVLLDHFDAGPAVRAVRDHHVSVLAGVPAMFQALIEVDNDAAPPESLASVRLAVSGAAPLEDDLVDGMRKRFGVMVHDGYGLTEASPIVTTSAIGGRETGAGSIGPPLPGVDVRLVDADGGDVLPGDPGEIWVKGPNVFPGYWGDPDATARALTPDGWLRTGDVAVADDQGELSLVDRAKDIIIVSGFNVYPAEVEEALLEHPDVAEAAVVGEPDPGTGEAIVAFVVPEPDTSPTPDALLAHCARSLARYKCPTRVEVVDALPRSFAGKVLRRRLRP